MRRYSRHKNSVRIFSAMTLFAAILFAASYYATSKKEQGAVIAKVNGQEIYQAEIEQKLRTIFDGQDADVKVPEIANLPKEVLEILIKETYLDKELSQLARKSGVESEAKVKDRIAAAESKILRQAYIEQEVEKEVTDQKVSAKYAEISSELAGKKEYSISHIVVKTKGEAEKLRREITAKKKAIRFADAAKKYSLDSESAERGGELGFVLEDNMIKEIADAISNLKPDEISQPIQTKFGWHLVRFTEVRDAQPLPFDAVKKNIRDQLEQDKVSEIEAKISKDAKVEILLKLSEPAAKKAEEPAAEKSPEAQIEPSVEGQSEQKNEEPQTSEEKQDVQQDRS